MILHCSSGCIAEQFVSKELVKCCLHQPSWLIDVLLRVIAAGEKELPLSYLFIDADDNSSSSDASALIYKLHTSDTIKYVEEFLV